MEAEEENCNDDIFDEICSNDDAKGNAYHNNADVEYNTMK
jgi:hypothetical protein